VSFSVQPLSSLARPGLRWPGRHGRAGPRHGQQWETVNDRVSPFRRCSGVGRPYLPFYGPYGDIRDTVGCEQFRAAFLVGCVGAWSLHPVQIQIAKKVFSPDAEEVRFARKVIEAIPDGRGVHMIDGKMQDDATWKQCKVMVTLAEMLARKEPELAEAYGVSRRRRSYGPGRGPPGDAIGRSGACAPRRGSLSLASKRQESLGPSRAVG
jgi:hypothetical protein